MTKYECLSLVVSILTSGVLFVTFLVLIKYAKDTNTLARTSVEQLPRPCVVLKQSADPSSEAVLTGQTTSLIGDNHYGSTLIFMNVGTGPAVNCLYRVSDIGGKQRGNHSYHLPEIGPSDSFETSHVLNSLSDNAALSIEYESVAGSPYLTEVVVEDRRWVRETRFTRPHSKKRRFWPIKS